MEASIAMRQYNSEERFRMSFALGTHPQFGLRDAAGRPTRRLDEHGDRWSPHRAVKCNLVGSGRQAGAVLILVPVTFVLLWATLVYAGSHDLLTIRAARCAGGPYSCNADSYCEANHCQHEIRPCKHNHPLQGVLGGILSDTRTTNGGTVPSRSVNNSADLVRTLVLSNCPT